MTNSIRRVYLQNRVLNPAEAEIWVTAAAEEGTATTELRGRLTGPRCSYATTVEVAYPLRPLPRPVEGLAGPTMRVVIPEPSWWDPVSPFLYDGSIELWQDGERCDAVQVRHGLRSVRFDGQRLRLNGKPLTLDAIEREQLSEKEALRLHEAGVNTLLIPVREDTRGIWDLADRLGFLVLGRFSGTSAEAPGEGHPSHLGWLLDVDALAAWTPSRSQTWVGVELHEVPETLPEGLQFVLCDEALLASLTSVALPKLIRTDAGDTRRKELLSVPGVLGTVVASMDQRN
jgi:hypothetical protein